MAVQPTVLVSNLGNEFDLGTIEANKIHIKVDGSSLVRNPTTGIVSVNPAALTTTNGLALVSPTLKSTVNGVAAAVDLTPAVKALETLTSIAYDPTTKKLTYNDEHGVAQVLDLSTLATDIYVNGGSYNAATGVLTLTDNNGSTPNVTIDLSELKKVETANTSSIKLTGTGQASRVLKADLIVDPAVGNLLQATATGVKVDPANIVGLATVDVQDAFGNHLYYAFP